MLLTVLGEYVLPAEDGVWQETLITALTSLDYKTQAARQALARSVSGGWLRTERHGRRARVYLTDETREMLSSGAERIYGFGEPHPWDGRWLLVVVRVPEQRRDVRHLIRSQLAWAGFGSLGNGLWISPHVDRESEVRRIVSELSPAELLSFRAEFGSVGDPAKVIADAWDVGDVADRYREFISRFGRLRPKIAGGDVPRPDGDGAHLAQVPVPGPGPAAGDAPAAMAADARARGVRRPPRRMAVTGAGVLQLARAAAARAARDRGGVALRQAARDGRHLKRRAVGAGC